MYSIGIAAQFLGVCVKTVRRWEKRKKISCFRTKGGHRRFTIQELERALTSTAIEESARNEGPPNACAVYGRVSSHKQKKRGDLGRQVDQLTAHAMERGYSIHSVYSDVGSGLNTNRKGLWKLVADGRKQRFSTVFVTFKDRLTRFGYKYLENYLSEFGVQLIPVHRLEDNTPESELVEDLVAIIHSFSGKMYRMRRSEKQRTKKRRKRQSPEKSD